MSVKTYVRYGSKIQNSAELQRALSRIPLEQARNFTKVLDEKMETSPHTGKIVTKARGGDFRIRHQQSRRGQRPAPFTRNLIRSIRGKSVGQFSARVDSDSPYVDKLIFELGRVVVSNSDLEEARKKQQQECNRVIRSFL